MFHCQFSLGDFALLEIRRSKNLDFQFTGRYLKQRELSIIELSPPLKSILSRRLDFLVDLGKITGEQKVDAVRIERIVTVSKKGHKS